MRTPSRTIDHSVASRRGGLPASPRAFAGYASTGRPFGFTLLELMIVLILLAIMLAFVWPNVVNSLRRAELANAGKEIRGLLGEARLDAIESGEVYLFRYQPGTGYYEVGPQTTTDSLEAQAALEVGVTDTTDAGLSDFDSGISDAGDSLGLDSSGLDSLGLDSTGFDDATSSATSNDLAADVPAVPIDTTGAVSMDAVPSATTYLTLPESIIFQAPAQAEVARVEEETEDESTEADLLMSDTQSSVWAPPIVFYPNGRTSSRRIRLINARPGSRQYSVNVVLRGLTGAARVEEVEVYRPELEAASTETTLNDPLLEDASNPTNLDLFGTEPSTFDTSLPTATQDDGGLTEGVFGEGTP